MEKKSDKDSTKELKIHRAAYKMLQDLEDKFLVDSIKLKDETKLWNLIRIIIFYHFQKKEAKPLYNVPSPSIIMENLLPIKYPKNVYFYGFSSTESRKLWNEKYYDIYMDPLYDILDEKFCVCEWPDEQGLRRKYQKEIYSKNYIPMHIPIASKTFWNLLLYKLSCRKNPEIENIDILNNIINYISEKYLIDEKNLRAHIYDSIIIFLHIKNFMYKFLEKTRPKIVFIRCAYGRFPMAISQACKELNITSVELQHGFINKYSPGYVKAKKTDNKDCIPNYFLAYGEKFADVVKHGYLFDPKKVYSIGFPYLEKVKDSEQQTEQIIKNFQEKFKKNILITSDSLIHIANYVEAFVQELSGAVSIKNNSIGIIFKPHPFDKKNYDHFNKFENVCVVNKYTSTYDLFKLVYIHTTVFSTSSIEALSFGVPNIILNVGEGYSENIKEIIDEKSSYMIDNVDQYIQKMNLILSDYKIHSKNAFQKSKEYFRPHAIKNFKDFLIKLDINIS